MDLRELSKDGESLVGHRRHPWELARVAALREIMEMSGVAAHLPYTPAILDIGCGDAYTIGQLCCDLTDPHIDGIDVYLEAEGLADLQHKNPLINFHNSYDTLSRKSYDLLTMFDVLEHIEDDCAFLKDLLQKHASPGSCLFVTVPAFNSLFSRHDTFLKHCRRYNHQQLLALLEGAGAKVVNSGYLFSSLLPVRFLTVCRERLCRGDSTSQQGVGHWRYGSIITSCLQAALMLDNRLSLALNRIGLRLPGLTVWALCKIP